MKYHCCIVNNTVLGDVNYAIYVEKSVENVRLGVWTLDDKSICYANFHWVVLQGRNVSDLHWNLKHKRLGSCGDCIATAQWVQNIYFDSPHSKRSRTKTFSAFWPLINWSENKNSVKQRVVG